MNLSDDELLRRGPSLLSPFIADNVQPASIDLRLDDTFLYPQRKYISPASHLRCPKPIELDDIDVGYDEVRANRYALDSGDFVLGSTIEYVMCPADMVARVEGRSSLGRLGLFVHVTAGFVNPGFNGKITLEIYNVNPRPIVLVAGHRICQINFSLLSLPAERPYGSPGLGSHYQDQRLPVGSRYEG